MDFISDPVDMDDTDEVITRVLWIFLQESNNKTGFQISDV